MPRGALLLVDTMIVIEAVRTGVWNAITGQRSVATVPECADELQRGRSAARSGYIPVGPEQLQRLETMPLSPVAETQLRLLYPAVDGLDPGERDLLALAVSLRVEFALCSCDKAALVAARALGLLDRTVSLESVAAAVGTRATMPFKQQFTEVRMRRWKTSLELGGQI